MPQRVLEMSDKPIGEIVGRHDSATAAAETAAPAAGEVPAQAAGSSAKELVAEPEDPIAGLKSALDKERDRASQFEKQHKASERERRRQAEQLAAYERDLHSLRAQVNKPDPKALEESFWSGGPHEFITQQFTDFEKRQHEAARQERIEEGKEFAREKFEDFEEVEAAFLDAARTDPSIWNGVTAKSPFMLATAVYRAGKKLLAGAENAPETRIAKLEAEIAQLRAGRDGGQPSAQVETTAAPATKPNVPRSNVGARSSGVGKPSSFAGPTPLGKVYGRQPRAG